ncbi:MAG: type II toxin-antitoxin system prevent-host-death family antitoxin [Proteobacteria bacterium]|nr:type II toxin-antitoxin system prevent-host-death family antitoxin [Pseudomonadota bacterium]
MHLFNMFEAKTNLSKLVEKALRGEEIIIARAGKPLVRLTPMKQPGKKRKFVFGALEGKGWAAPDWDSPEVNKEIENDFYQGMEEEEDLYR